MVRFRHGWQLVILWMTRHLWQSAAVLYRAGRGCPTSFLIRLIHLLLGCPGFRVPSIFPWSITSPDNCLATSQSDRIAYGLLIRDKSLLCPISCKMLGWPWDSQHPPAPELIKGVNSILVCLVDGPWFAGSSSSCLSMWLKNHRWRCLTVVMRDGYLVAHTVEALNTSAWFCNRMWRMRISCSPYL